MTYRPNPNTAAPAAAALGGSEVIGASQAGVDVGIPLPALAAYVLATLSSAAPVQLPVSAIYQRTTRSGGAFGQGAATVAWSVSVAGVPGAALSFRLRDATAAGNPVVAAGAQALATTVLGAQAVSLSIPCGPYWYFIDWQLGAGPWVLGTQKFAVGEVLAVAGQSLADRLMHDFSGTTMAAAGIAVPALHSTYMTWTDSGGSGPSNAAWSPVADGTALSSGFAAQLANRWSALGVPAAVVGFAAGGTSITTWQPGQANYAQLKAVLQGAGQFGSLFWFQGHSDAAAGMSAATYQAQLAAIVTQIKSDFPASAAFKLLIATIPDIASTAWGTDAQIGAIRQGAAAYAAANPSFASVLASMLDIPLVDGVHETQAGNAAVADHVFRAMRGAFGLDPAGDAGPVITGASRASGSAVVKLALAQAGGTGLVAVPNLLTVANQFGVYPSGSMSGPYAISGVSFPSATEIDLTLSTTPADSVALGVRYRLLPDASAAVQAAAIYDNNAADGLAHGRQLALYVGEITAAAPAGAVAAPGAPTVAAGTPTSSTIPLTITAGSGGAPASYTVTYTPSGGTAQTTTSTGNGVTLSGLLAGTTYTISATATNSAGTGPASASVSATTAAATSSYIASLPAVGPGGGVAPVAAYDATLLAGTAGAAVATIPDQSASNLPLTTAGGVVLGSTNGKTSAHFPTGATALNTAASSKLAGLNASDMTVLYVAKQTSSGSSANPNGVGFFVGDASGQNNVFSFQTWQGSGIFFGRTTGGSNAYAGAGSNVPAALTKEVATYAAATGAMAMNVSGGSTGTGTGSNGTAAWTQIGVGTNNTADAHNTSYAMDLLAMIVWPAQATAAQQSALLAWATQQYGS